MNFTKTATTVAAAALLGIGSVGAMAQGTGGGSSSAGTSGAASSGGGNTNSTTTPGGTDVTGGAAESRNGTGMGATGQGGYHWWQKEWWQQHGRNNRVTREEYMNQMSRRWDDLDRSKRGYVEADELARAFGDETTSPATTPPSAGTNDGGRSVYPGSMGGSTTPLPRTGNMSSGAPR